MSRSSAWATRESAGSTASRRDWTNRSEPTAGKNRLYLDVKVARGLSADGRRARIEAEATRLSAAGGSIARHVDEPDEFWIIMHDVEGNEFCVI